MDMRIDHPLRQVGWRYLVRRRWQTIMMVIGVMLGVALVVAVDMANASAARAFTLSTEAVTGRATHQITGGPNGVPDAVYFELRRSGLPVITAPILSTYTSSEQLGSRPFQILGIDPFADSPFRSYLNTEGPLPLDQLTQFLTRPGAILISRENADRYDLQLGDDVSLNIGGRQRTVVIAGLLDPTDGLARRAVDGLLLADIATVQEITGKIGWLERIDLIIASDSQQAQVESWLPDGVRLAAVAARQGSVEQMTAAFRLNLTALSMLALVVGLFLIYNTMTFSVVQRRQLFGTLRCLGVTRSEVFWLVTSEAAIVGLIGAALGIVVGIFLGRQTVSMVTQTMSDLFFTATVRGVGIPLESLLKGGLAGFTATILTAALPAWEAASIPPRAALSRSGLESKARKVVVWLAGAGAGLIMIGILTFSLPTRSLLTGFSGTFAVVFGFAMLAAITMVGLMKVLDPVLGRIFGFLGRLAPRNLLNSLSRTAVATAALMVAVAVTIGVTLMIESFRHTVNLWLEATLQGDIYISAPAYTGAVPSEPIDPQILEKVATWPGVSQVDVLRSVAVDSPQGVVRVSASSNPNIARERLFLEAMPAAEIVWQELLAGGVLVSEPLARRLNLLQAGAEIALFTPSGEQRFPVVGVYYDYAASEGSLLMARPLYQQIWQDDRVTAVDIRLADVSQAESISVIMQDVFNPTQQLFIRPNSSLRQEVLTIFDRTFAITSALRILATLVAFIGILNTLLLLQLEKQRELGILRALGLTGRQLWRLVLLETGLMGLSAGLLAAPTGYVLSLILIYIINQRSFGWTLQLALEPGAFLQAMAIAVSAALLAGIYPAWRLGRMETADVIRFE